MKRTDKFGNPLCGRRTTVSANYRAGTGSVIYRCEKPAGHRSREHICGDVRWAEPRVKPKAKLVPWTGRA